MQLLGPWSPKYLFSMICLTPPILPILQKVMLWLSERGDLIATQTI